jgi:hypothetical protein
MSVDEHLLRTATKAALEILEKQGIAKRDLDPRNPEHLMRFMLICNEQTDWLRQLQRRARRIILSAAAVISLGLIDPAAAQPGGRPELLGVYDARGAFVCTYDHDDTCYREYNGKPYTLGFDVAANEPFDGAAHGGLQVNALWVFTSNNCTGQAWDYYFWEGRAPVPIARFDGVSLWASDITVETIAANSYQVVGWSYVYGPGYPPGCIPYSWTALVTAPILLSSPVTWVSPFSVR